MTTSTPQIFISYAHESPDFSATVWQLAEWLRHNKGVEVITDHPYENRAPQNGWRAWMQHCVEDCDLVLIVCTPKYKASFEKRDAHLLEGLGRTWEAAIITQELYESKVQNSKFIPILPDTGNHKDVPVVLRDFSCGLKFPSEYERIADAITEEIVDPNANLPHFQRRPKGQLSADDARLIPDQRDVYGRDSEIAQVVEFLESSQSASQVVAQLTGTGGIGKTEVCKRSLKTWLQNNPGVRAYWVGLRDGASPAECAADIASALGHDNLERPEALFPLLKAGLYYLDNLESLDSAEGNAFLRQIYQHSGVRILASTRVNLAALGKPIEIDRLPLPAAITTFKEAWTGDDNPEASTGFSDFVENNLGCHALSVVLVAALGAEKSLASLIRSWQTKGTAIARQENDPTRRGSLAISLHLTSDILLQRPGALLLWSIAALFPEGINQSVIDSVYQSNSIINDDSLSALVRHRILKRKGENYVMLPPVARFALDAAKDETSGFSWYEARAILSPILFGWIESADSITSIPSAFMTRQFLLGQFSAIHRFLLEECTYPAADLSILVLFYNGLHNQYNYNVTLGKEILVTLSSRLSKGKVNQESYARALMKLGDLESRLGNVERARQLYDDAIGLFRKEQSDLGLANTLQALGDLERRLGNVERARQLYDNAIGLFRKEQSDLGLANTLQALGDLESRLGNVERARQLYDDAIGLFRKEQSDLGLANALKALGDLESRLGNVARARQLYDDAIGLFRKEQADLGLANAIKVLGDLESRLGNVERARQLYGDAIGLFRKEQDDLGLANAIKALGDLESQLGNVERARQLYGDTIGLFRKEQSDLGLANVLQSIGDLYLADQEPNKALKTYEEALLLYQRVQEPMGTAYTAAETLRCHFALKNTEPMASLAELAWQAAETSGLENVKHYVVRTMIDVGLIDPKAFE